VFDKPIFRCNVQQLRLKNQNALSSLELALAQAKIMSKFVLYMKFFIIHGNFLM
jgi:hypothetical protein